MRSITNKISLDRLLGNLPGLAYRCLNDPSWTMEFVSDGALALTGYRPEDLLHNRTLSYADIIHAEDRELVFEQVNAALKENRAFQVSYRITTASGVQKWVWEQGCAVLDERGSIVALEGFVTDITAAKQAELDAEKSALAQRLIIATQQEITSSQLDRQALLDLIALRAQELTGASGATVDLVDGNELVYLAKSGAAPEMLGLRLQRDGSLTGLAVKTGKVLYCADAELDDRVDRALCREADIRSVVVAPFRSGEQINGVVKVISPCANAFARSDVKNLQILVESLGTVIHRYDAVERLRNSELQYRLLFENNPHPMWVFEAETYRFLAVNRAAVLHYGYSKEEFLSMRIQDIRPKEDVPTLENWIGTLKEKSSAGKIWRHMKKNGMHIQVDIRSDEIDFNGRKARLVLANDVTEWIQAERDLERASRENLRLALYDPLTKLPNRLLLTSRLEHALSVNERSARHGALLFIDLDNFKYLNDTFGHNVGDLFLQECARRITNCLRSGDTVARLGGDEFVVLLEGLSAVACEASTQAKSAAEKILAAFIQPCKLAGHEHYTTASIGITLFGEAPESVTTLLKQADLAMYQAKAAGRNAFRLFDPGMQAVVTARSVLEADLRRALQEKEFSLYFQPQVDMDGVVIGAEALIRWHHSERGMVPPLEFIPLAEDTGLIVAIGNWVLEAACNQLAYWAKESATAHLSLAVNVSARQFRHPAFVSHLCKLLDASGIQASQLELELTESLLVDDMDMTIEKMSQLKEKGITFSLDDFGTGYSSLYYLKGLPLDKLKIDQSFVRDVIHDPSDATIVKTIIALGKSLGLKVIAEGVETKAQRDFLTLQGCRWFQGYFFGRPVPSKEFEASLPVQPAARQASA